MLSAYIWLIHPTHRYWGNGCQIIPPHDSGIFKAIEENKDHICWDTSLVDSSPLVEKRLSEVKDAYFKAVGSIADSSSMATSAKGGFKFVYTPMHGVGLPAMKRVVEDLGLLESMVIVEEQVRLIVTPILQPSLAFCGVTNPPHPSVSRPNPTPSSPL